MAPVTLDRRRLGFDCPVKDPNAVVGLGRCREAEPARREVIGARHVTVQLFDPRREALRVVQVGSDRIAQAPRDPAPVDAVAIRGGGSVRTYGLNLAPVGCRQFPDDIRARANEVRGSRE
jgi:hypothetical protein